MSDTWETCKENARPLERGRNVVELNEALGKQAAGVLHRAFAARPFSL